MIRRRSTLAALAAAPLATALATPGIAQARPIRVYHAFPEGMDAVAAAFTAAGGGRVELVAVGAGVIAQRIMDERRNPQADAVLAVAPQLVDLNPGAFTRYEPAGFAQVLAALKQGQPWAPFSLVIPTVLAVNTRLVQDSAMPRSWRDVADPKWRGQVAYAGIERSGSALEQMLQVVHAVGEAEGFDVFARIFRNSVVTGSSGEVHRRVARGDSAIGLTLEDFAQVEIDAGAPLRIVYPQEGVALAPSAMALVDGAPNAGGGRALMDFVLTTEAQTLLVNRFRRRPVRTDMPQPQGLPAIASLPIRTPEINWWLPQLPGLMGRYNALQRG